MLCTTGSSQSCGLSFVLTRARVREIDREFRFIRFEDEAISLE